MPALDEMIAGKYRVVRIIAEGGMGVVVEAQHVRLDRPVALKILHPNVREDAEISARFEREARAAARITGLNVARVLDVDNLEDGTPFMVMELLQGHDLAAELGKRKKLHVHEAVRYVMQACVAMHEAHHLGIVHRDLKPSNLFLCDSKESERTVKVLDFGISKATSIDDVSMTATHSVLGTPLYMSPEQVRSAKNVDARADIWSLGVILYELLAGQPPFQARSATAIAAAIVADTPMPLDDVRDDVPAQLQAVIFKALEKNPDKRYQSVFALAGAIAPFGSKDMAQLMEAMRAQSTLRSADSDARAAASGVQGASELERTTLTQRRNRKLIGVAGVLVLAGLAALFLRMPGAPQGQSPASATPCAQPSVAAPVEARPSAVQAAAGSAPSSPVANLASATAPAAAASARARPSAKPAVPGAPPAAATPPPPAPTTATPTATNPVHL